MIPHDPDLWPKLAAETQAADVTSMPARPAVRVLDLLRAADGALVVGDVYATRGLLASAMKAMEGQEGVVELDAERVKRGR